MTTNADRLEQIKKRLAAATEGPWEVKPGTTDVVAAIRNDVATGNLPLPEFLQAASDIHISIKFPAKHANDFPSWHGRENADFIARAPEDIAWLIEQVETLQLPPGFNALAEVLTGDDLDEEFIEQDNQQMIELAGLRALKQRIEMRITELEAENNSDAEIGMYSVATGVTLEELQRLLKPEGQG